MPRSSAMIVRVGKALSVLAVASLLLASDHLGASQDHVRDELIEGASPQVVRGAESFDRNCAVCHGDSGLGLAEAKRAFPADHRSCTRCHKPNNPVVMSLEEVVAEGRDHDLFPIGDPPPLRGQGALAGFATPAALFQYAQATMPRYRPGSVEPAEMLDITAFLWHASGRVDAPGARTFELLPEDVGLPD